MDAYYIEKCLYVIIDANLVSALNCLTHFMKVAFHIYTAVEADGVLSMRWKAGFIRLLLRLWVGGRLKLKFQR